MRKISRRDLIKQIGLAGASAAVASSLVESSPIGTGESPTELRTLVVPLGGRWLFKLATGSTDSSQGGDLPDTGRGGRSQVTVPHTWQISADSAEYQGPAWYKTNFEAPATWVDKTVRIEFQAVTHSATVWLNDQLVGKHLRKGYTAFSFDISSDLKLGAANTLIVKVDNSFDEDMLPCGKSFDWTVDGGIIRPVSLLISPRIYMERVEIDAVPNLETSRRARKDETVETQLGIRVVVRNAAPDPKTVKVNYRFSYGDMQYGGAPNGGVTASLAPGATRTFAPPTEVARMALWDFDHPALYWLVAEIECDGKPLHSYVETFGVRKFEVREGGFYLNGERVRLIGVERMAGSHPDYGMAEPSSWITHDHEDLKELNCVFTRVHWQQDRRVLDYCDRHGILIQEEVPAWGPDTFKGMTTEPTPEIMQNGLEQLREMIERDRNHPSIIAWGLCNEVNGQNPPAQTFIKRMAEEAKKLDPHRLVTYASNTLQENAQRDAAGLLDFISWNEYYESWYGGNTASVRRNLEEIHRAFPEKPVVVSEYGYCECTPERLGGDVRRIEILRDHTNVYREFDFVAGAIFFDYSDYRTHVGDKGMGVLKQRVHGVVDLYGARKPSFEALRQESSPIESLRLEAESGAVKATVKTRETLPAYTLDGYRLRWINVGFGDLPMEQGVVNLPKLAPGQETTIPIRFHEMNTRRVRVDVLRPTGFSALTAWWKP